MFNVQESLYVLLLFVAGSCMVATAARVPVQAVPASVAVGSSIPGPRNVQRVPVDLFVMSKCPDAVYCESHLAPLLADLQQYITLQLHFIGQKRDDGSWVCKHGKEECAGNTQQLCVQQYSKPYNRVKWLLTFVLCNNKHGLNATGSFVTASKCLRDVGIPLSAATKMLACMYGPSHTNLLEADFATSATLGVSTSCTVQYSGDTVAIRDRGAWVQAPGGGGEGGFRDALCAAYAALNRGRLPTECRGVQGRGLAA